MSIVSKDSDGRTDGAVRIALMGEKVSGVELNLLQIKLK